MVRASSPVGSRIGSQRNARSRALRTAGVESDEVFTFVVNRRVCTMVCRSAATKWPIPKRAVPKSVRCAAPLGNPSYPA